MFLKTWCLGPQVPGRCHDAGFGVAMVSFCPLCKSSSAHGSNNVVCETHWKSYGMMVASKVRIFLVVDR